MAKEHIGNVRARLIRLIPSNVCRYAAVDFFRECLPTEQIIIEKFLTDWDRLHFPNDSSSVMIREQAIPIIQDWLKTAKDCDVALARKFLDCLTTVKKKNDKEEKRKRKQREEKRRDDNAKSQGGRMSQVSESNSLPVSPLPKSGRSTPRESSKGTPRGSSMLRFSSHMHEVTDDELQRSSRSSTPKNVEYIATYPHHKNMYEPVTTVEDRSEAEESVDFRKTYPRLTHHKWGYGDVPKAMTYEGALSGNDGPENANSDDEPPAQQPRLPHHKTLYGQIDLPAKPQNSSPRSGTTAYCRVAHHKMLYGHIVRPEPMINNPSSNDEYEQYGTYRQPHHKYMYDPFPMVNNTAGEDDSYNQRGDSSLENEDYLSDGVEGFDERYDEDLYRIKDDELEGNPPFHVCDKQTSPISFSPHTPKTHFDASSQVHRADFPGEANSTPDPANSELVGGLLKRSSILSDATIRMELENSLNPSPSLFGDPEKLSEEAERLQVEEMLLELSGSKREIAEKNLEQNQNKNHESTKKKRGNKALKKNEKLNKKNGKSKQKNQPKRESKPTEEHSKEKTSEELVEKDEREEMNQKEKKVDRNRPSERLLSTRRSLRESVRIDAPLSAPASRFSTYSAASDITAMKAYPGRPYQPSRIY